MGGTCSTVDKD